MRIKECLQRLEFTRRRPQASDGVSEGFGRRRVRCEGRFQIEEIVNLTFEKHCRVATFVDQLLDQFDLDFERVRSAVIGILVKQNDRFVAHIANQVVQSIGCMRILLIRRLCEYRTCVANRENRREEKNCACRSHPEPHPTEKVRLGVEEELASSHSVRPGNATGFQ